MCEHAQSCRAKPKHALPALRVLAGVVCALPAAAADGRAEEVLRDHVFVALAAPSKTGGAMSKMFAAAGLGAVRQTGETVSTGLKALLLVMRRLQALPAALRPKSSALLRHVPPLLVSVCEAVATDREQTHADCVASLSLVADILALPAAPALVSEWPQWEAGEGDLRAGLFVSGDGAEVGGWQWSVAQMRGMVAGANLEASVAALMALQRIVSVLSLASAAPGAGGARGARGDAGGVAGMATTRLHALAQDMAEPLAALLSQASLVQAGDAAALPAKAPKRKAACPPKLEMPLRALHSCLVLFPALRPAWPRGRCLAWLAQLVHHSSLWCVRQLCHRVSVSGCTRHLSGASELLHPPFTAVLFPHIPPSVLVCMALVAPGPGPRGGYRGSRSQPSLHAPDASQQASECERDASQRVRASIDARVAARLLAPV